MEAGVVTKKRNLLGPDLIDDCAVIQSNADFFADVLPTLFGKIIKKEK
jgi:hypothetical protein